MPSEGIKLSTRAVPSLRLLRAVALAWAMLACAAASGAASTPMSGGGAVVLEPVPPRESPRTWRRLVFTCTTPGLVIFSDRPCGPVPAVHELKLTAPVAAPGANPNVTPPAPAASPHAASAVRERDDARAPDDGARRAEACRRLGDAVQALDARMRAGYSAREAARLWARWREAKERLREADC